MAIIQKRQPAKKFWIADMLNAEQKTNEQGFKYYTIRGKEAIRVNIIAGVISSYINEIGNYAMITLDDSSSQIRLKAWNEDVKQLANLHIGEIVLVIGRINTNETNTEIFIRPEIIKPVAIDWMELRLKELKKEFGKAPPVKEIITEPQKIKEELIEEIPDEPVAGVALAVRERILQAIEANDTSNGAEISVVIKNSGVQESEAEAAINELIREGEAFQLKHGFIKLIS
ncbi:MAG: hypothetical protein KJ600_05285 [Nanoarchaeota archaeon]|nr:hypothetical protein [Nanoarchaeota archaeon]